METFAWIGVGIGAVFMTLFVISWWADMLRSPTGRAIVAAYALIALAAWGVVGGAWLLWNHGG